MNGVPGTAEEFCTGSDGAEGGGIPPFARKEAKDGAPSFISGSRAGHSARSFLSDEDSVVTTSACE
jgi:hypothetical protein